MQLWPMGHEGNSAGGLWKRVLTPKKKKALGEEMIFYFSLKIFGLCNDIWNHGSHLPISLRM